MVSMSALPRVKPWVVMILVVVAAGRRGAR